MRPQTQSRHRTVCSASTLCLISAPLSTRGSGRGCSKPKITQEEDLTFQVLSRLRNGSGQSSLLFTPFVVLRARDYQTSLEFSWIMEEEQFLKKGCTILGEKRDAGQQEPEVCLLLKWTWSLSYL